MKAPPSVKPTVPVGELPDTVAVKITVLPNVAGLAELDSVVVVAAAPPPPLIVSTSVSLDAALAALPL